MEFFDFTRDLKVNEYDQLKPVSWSTKKDRKRRKRNILNVKTAVLLEGHFPAGCLPAGCCGLLEPLKGSSKELQRIC